MKRTQPIFSKHNNLVLLLPLSSICDAEKVGDVLRYSSRWIMGLPSGEGLAATAAFTGVGPTWQCTMFDVMKAKNWEQVVEALTSNVDVSSMRLGSCPCFEASL